MAEDRHQLMELKDVNMQKTYPVEGHEYSMLPDGCQWKMVWNDEFDGTALDESKWNYRLNFWGFRMPAYSREGVEFDGNSHMRMNLVRHGDDFCSAHLQTGSLTFDMPRDSNGFWPFGKLEPAKFMHKFGYYEICCRLPKNPGWWAAFWLQAPGIGSHPDPAQCGVECDIMESYRKPKENMVICGNLWGGYGKDACGYGHFRFPFAETEDGWHRYGVNWTPEGYIFYADGKEVGRQMAPKSAVSNVEQFILVSTECAGYRKVIHNEDGTIGLGSSPDPDLFNAIPDYFEVDYVRVFDKVEG